jgi:GT2 family glycosyltransferase
MQSLSNSSYRSLLRVSIVCYASSEPQLRKTLETLFCAGQKCLDERLVDHIDICLVDNGPAPVERLKLDRLISAMTGPHELNFRCCGDGNNIGFGAGHNLTFNPLNSKFHLILNPDVELAPDALGAAIRFMNENSDCEMIAPAVINKAGETEYLCKRYPTVLDLLLRGFAPAWLRAFFKRRLDRYEMRDALADNVLWNPPLISGCFMFLRSTLLSKLTGFDPRYFLYFEDYDLALRAHEVTRIAYVPSVRVVHHGGYAARKGWRHIALFIRSAIVFFNDHGWRWY